MNGRWYQVKIKKESVGQRIHDLRKSKNVSMEELAKKVGASGKSTVNTWEKGLTIPRAKYLESLADYFGVSVNYLKYGTLKNYLIDLVITDFDSKNSLIGSRVEDYIGVVTDYYGFKNGVPVGNIPTEKYGDFYHEGELAFIREAFDSHFSDISKFLGSSLKYNNDTEILKKLEQWLISATSNAGTTFAGMERLFRDGLEKWMPSSMGYENQTVEEVKKDDKFMSNWPDEKILDTIYQSKLLNWQMDALEKLSNLNEEYKKELEKLKKNN